MPSREAVHSEGELVAAILALAPRFLTYALSFLTLTIFWFVQQAQHGLIARSDRRLATLNPCFLAFIRAAAILDRSAGRFPGIQDRGAGLLAEPADAWRRAVFELVVCRQERHDRRGCRRGDAAHRLQRIVKAQVLWAVGAALCLITPLLSIVFILLVQLIYAAAPRSSLLRKLIG